MIVCMVFFFSRGRHCVPAEETLRERMEHGMEQRRQVAKRVGRNKKLADNFGAVSAHRLQESICEREYKQHAAQCRVQQAREAEDWGRLEGARDIEVRISEVHTALSVFQGFGYV